jgi:integrase
MLRQGGRRPSLDQALLTDDEFKQIQRHHFGRKNDPAARRRSQATLAECLDAIDAFKAITGLDAVAAATPDDCARFQAEALKRPTDWRSQGRPAGGCPHTKPRPSKTQRRRELSGADEAGGRTISPNTVLKWSRMLQAAFERANRNAARRKCVRGVVPEAKLLTVNPWTQFTWIEGTRRPIRQFDANELLDLLGFLESGWPGVPSAALAVKVLLWSCCRKLEVAGLTWDSLRLVEGQVHFEVVGKWGVQHWFRIPGPLYQEMLAGRTDSPFIFAAYVDQICRTHAKNSGCLTKI